MKTFLLLCCLFVSPVACAYDPPRPQSILLWEDGVPHGNPGDTPGFDDGTGRYWEVGVPSMWVYTPPGDAPAEGRMALVVCCGGGYTHLTRLVGADGAVEHFLPKDVVVVALRYRLAPTATDVERDATADALRAIQLLRANAQQWGIHPERIGLFGWSAGGNLALNVASQAGPGQQDASDPVARQSSRPNFLGMLCPWPGRPAKPISEYPIGPTAPPAFIAAAEDDRTAPVSFAQGIAGAYQQAGVEHQLFIVPHGGHGAFTINAPGPGGQWPRHFWQWVQAQGYASTAE